LRRTDVHQMAEALSAVADHVGPVYGVIAHSLGAAAAVQLLADGRHAAARLVLIAPGGELAADIRRLAQALDLPPRCVAALVAALERHYDMPVEMCSISRLARMLNVAALVVHDVDDKVIPFAEGAQVARSLPGARFHATERLGHRRILRDAAVIGSVVEFCRARRARTA
ncbi:MAG TPA: alpha/beta hydrolase, partial [Nevskiaceae bacterium]|nr:alpha/beta hydrolase [Nevskiaceae bacterium]